MHNRLIFQLLLVVGGVLSAAAYADVAAPVTIPPPLLPVFEQPVCPGDGYIWTPGYWAWDDGYYWVPGTWVLDPQPGFLWTPGYWSSVTGGFAFHEGYWSPTVGFYGGIDYGFGYTGFGYQGGHWESGHFDYNTALSRVDTNVIRHVYNQTVTEPVSRVSYNGGPGGVSASGDEESGASVLATHLGPVAAQTQHVFVAKNNPKQRYSANHGTPPVAATTLPDLAVHPKELPPIARLTAPITGSAEMNQKYQKDQDQIVARQNQDREKLQQKQDKEDQEAKQKDSQAKAQQLERQHQQQTQELAQRHAQQIQQWQQRQ
jgi:hypothetical protein